MKIGEIIRINRIKNGLTQGELADGIISVSYLSKIENNQVLSNNEIYELLLDKMGVEFNLEQKGGDNNEEWAKLSDNWFISLIEEFDTNNIISYYDQFKNIKDKIKDQSIKIIIDIHMIRYYCKIEDLTSAKNQVSLLLPISSSFNNEHQYYWNKFRGNIASLLSNLEEAYSYYIAAERISIQINISENELADLYYSIGTTCSGLRRTSEAILNMDKSLLIYQRNYNTKRCSQCHIVLGISYRRTNNYEKATYHYNLAINLSRKIKDYDLTGLAHMNMGHLLSTKGESRKAIEMYTQSLNYYKQNNEKLIAILSIIKEFSIQKNKSDVKYWIYKGLAIIENDNKSEYKEYQIELTVYKHLIEKQFILLEHQIKNKVIPMFKEKRNHTKLAYYSSILSDYYATQRMYKKALEYQRTAKLAYQKLINI